MGCPVLYVDLQIIRLQLILQMKLGKPVEKKDLDKAKGALDRSRKELENQGNNCSSLRSRLGTLMTALWKKAAENQVIEEDQIPKHGRISMRTMRFRELAVS